MAVKYIATKVGGIDADLTGNVAGSELTSNKENTTIDTNTTKYPTVNLLNTGLSSKQDTLVNQVNIKSVSFNGGTQYSLLGSGNFDIVIAGGSSSLSSVTAATADNTIDNLNFKQVWNWNSLINGSGLKLATSATPDASASQTIVTLESTGVNNNINNRTVKIVNSKTGTGANLGLRLEASGAYANIALSTNSGSLVIIGSTTDYTGLSATTPFQVASKDAQNYSVALAGRMRMQYASYLSLWFTNGMNNCIGGDANGFVIYNGSNDSRFGATGALSIGNNGAIANSKAQLDVGSTTKGALLPRMTTVQKNAITSPPEGLIVYDTTLKKLCIYTTAWETITSI